MAQPETDSSAPSLSGFLGAVERIGNRLPDPVTLFFLGSILILVLSEIASAAGWSVDHPVTGEEQTVKSLLRRDGLYWVWENLVTNFTGFAPLGVVLVAMLGIGVAERSGLVGTLLKLIVLITPEKLLTPAVMFAGVMSSMAIDAGYVVLPPLAAAVFLRAGRSPIVGIACVFAGVAAGFSANLLVTALDPLLQNLTQSAAAILDPDYTVDPRCNYYFMIVSTIMITLVGWYVTDRIVEPRYRDRPLDPPEDDDGASGAGAAADDPNSTQITADDRRGMIGAAIALALASGVVLAMIFVDGWALQGTVELQPGWPVDRWVRAIVPILFVLFLAPGIGFGIATGSIKSDRDVARMMTETMKMMGSYVVLAFFAGQFVAWFSESNLGVLFALEGIAYLSEKDLPLWLFVLAIIALTAGLNLFVGSASAKWAFISTVFVPVLMGLGVSPELTQAAYRVGDSVSNSIAPLNPYVVVMLVFLQRYVRRAGIGSLVALMLPYTVWFSIVWSALLLGWMALGIPLGPDAKPLFIEPIGGQ